MTTDALWRHTESGRLYREGDPAHDFARLVGFLRAEVEQFADHYDRRVKGRDYLDIAQIWLSDPDRIARVMADTIARIDKAYTALRVDRDMPDYGLGQRDEEWQRKYGPVRDPNDNAGTGA